MKNPVDHGRALWQKAGNDLIAARATLSTRQALDTVCFHAQQAVEKCLKAVLALHDLEYPRRHDLAELIQLVKPLVPAIVPHEDHIISMAPFAVEIRYDTELAPSMETASEMLQTATEVHELIGAIIESKAQDLDQRSNV